MGGGKLDQMGGGGKLDQKSGVEIGLLFLVQGEKLGGGQMILCPPGGMAPVAPPLYAPA